MKTEQRTRIEQHGRDLLAIFPNATEKDPVKLCRKLRRIEAEAAKIGLQLCNGPEMTEDEQDARVSTVLAKVGKLLQFQAAGVPVFVNLDPRGYALKVNDEWLRDQCNHNRLPLGDAFRRLHKDWGGYGIIAPEID